MKRWLGAVKRWLEAEHARALAGVGLFAIMSIGAWWMLTDSRTAGTAAARTVAPADRVTFADRTLALGVLAEHRQGDDRLTGLDETLGSGACALDYDNDGWTDLFVVNGSGDTRYYGRRHWWQSKAGHTLLRNRGAGHFEDMSATALAGRPMRGYGCVAADFDNDGHTDVFVTGFDESLLLRNLGNGRFLDMTAAAGLKAHGWQTAAAVADVDGDGLLDLYVGRLIEFQKGARTYEPGSQYKQDVPASFNSALYPAQANSLYRNLGGFRFEDVAERAGVANPDGRTLGALWLDLDDDQRPDLIVANAAGTGSTVAFRNEGKWRFSPLGTGTRLQAAAGARAPTLADLDNDGVPEILMTASNGAQSAIFVRQNSPGSSHPVFSDRARPLGFAREDYSGFSPWSALAADFNNDGWLDVFVTNGLAIPDPDVQRLTVGQPKQLWLNSRRGALLAQQFDASAPLGERQSARGAVAADFDNDGDVDLYVAHNNDLGQLLVNESAAGPHWLGVRLVDTQGNRDAIGARVELQSAVGAQYRWVTSGMAFLSGSERRLHFGLGARASIERVVVTWPDGDESTFRRLPADRYVTLRRGEPPQIEAPVASAVPGNYSSLAHGSEPALRADYIRLLVAARGLEASIEEVRASLSDPDVAVRETSVAILGASQTTTSLALLLDAFADEEPRVVVAAVASVCRYEEERATRWLLRLFGHPAAAVRAAVADCFAFYFHEEEAVVHRKYLAIPYLIVALADADEQVQIAASRALGNAERFRGVQPLLDLAARTANAAVRAQAIRALGLIRDKYAIAGLAALLHDRKMDAQPESLAQLLIAFKRLDHPALSSVMADFSAGRGEFASLPALSRLAVLRELLSSEDGVVIARSDIAAMARRTYEKAGKGAAAEEPTVLALLEVLSNANSRESLQMLTKLAGDGRTAAIKASALRALVAVDAAHAAKYVERAIDGSDRELARRFLERMAGTYVDVADRVLLAAIDRPEIGADVVRIVRRVRTAAAAEALQRVAGDRSATTNVRVAAVHALARSEFKLKLANDLYATQDEALARAIVQYEMSRLPALYVSRASPQSVNRLLDSPSQAVRLATLDALAARREFWAKRRILDVLQQSTDIPLRRRVLDLIAGNALEGSQVLEAIATDKADPLRVEALRRLEGRPGSSAEQLLLTVLKDASEPPQVRIVAAHRLVARLGAEVLTLIERRPG